MQNSTGAISGVVQDATAAAVAGTNVRILNQDTGLTRTVQTNELGQYTAPALPVGMYSIRVEKAGFRAEVQNNITLEIQQVRAVDFTLQVGQVREAVTVDATVPLFAFPLARIFCRLIQRGRRCQDTLTHHLAGTTAPGSGSCSSEARQVRPGRQLRRPPPARILL